MPATINEYIEQYESDTYKSLNEIYKTIKAAVPNASEAMSYGMPTFKLYGKNLIHFVVSKHHIGIYPSPGAVLHFAEKTKKYKTSKGTIQLQSSEPLPLDLVREITQFRVDVLTDQYGKKTDRNNMTTHDKVSTREPNNKKALETGSGIAWSEWVGLLQEYKDLNHTDMAKVVYEIIMERGLSKSPEWWAQGVTVAYEKYIGRRKLGQQSNDSFSVTVSKTFTGDMDEALTRWLQLVDGVHEFDSVKLLGSPRFSKTEKWRYWRCSLEDGSVVAVNIQTKPGGEKSGVAVNHDKLSNESDVERWRKYWKQFVLSYGV